MTELPSANEAVRNIIRHETQEICECMLDIVKQQRKQNLMFIVWFFMLLFCLAALQSQILIIGWKVYQLECHATNQVKQQELVFIGEQ